MEREQLAKRLVEEQEKFGRLNAMISQLTQELMQTQGKIILLQEMLKDFESKEQEHSTTAASSVPTKKERKEKKGKRNGKKEKRE